MGIPLPALQVQPPGDPLKQYAEIISLQSLRQQQQARQQLLPLEVQAQQQQNQIRQQQMNDANIYMQSLRANKGDLDAALDHAAQNGMSGIGYMQFGQQILARKAALAKLTGEQLDAQAKMNDQLAGHLDEVRSAGAEGSPERAAALQRVIQTYPALQSRIPQGLNPSDAQLDQFETGLMGMKWSAENALAKRKVNIEQIAAEARKSAADTAAKRLEAELPGGPLADVNRTEMQSWLSAHPGKTPADFMRYQKTLVPAFNFNLQAQGPGQGTVENLNPGEQATVQAILEGRMNPPSFAGRSPYWQKIMQAVNLQDPQFNAQRAELRKSFTVGPQSKEINAANTALQHMGVLSDAVDALNNGDVQLLNRIGNSVGAQIGQTPQTTFKTIVNRVGPELSQAYGQATGKERGEVEGDLGLNLSPAQLRGNIGVSATLLRGKLDSLANQWEQNKAPTMPGFSDRFISPQAQQVLQKLGAGSEQHSPGKQAGLPDGRTGTGSDGKKYVVKGGVWVPQ